jgi:hypothetical protein
MLSGFITQFGTALGKGFLLSGIVPAAVYLLGWRWYHHGSRGLTASLSGLLDSETTTLSAFALVAVGLLFFAGRSFFVHVLQNLPGPLLRGLRERLVAEKIARHRKLDCERERLLWQLTALDWPQGKEGFVNPAFIPAWAAADFADYPAEQASRSGRRELSYLARSTRSQAVLCSSEETRRVADGIWALYRWGAKSPNAVRYLAEVAAWRELLASHEVNGRLREVRRTVHARWADVFRESQSFPEESWQCPTVLGSHLASLEMYAERRYAIDTSALWVRLWGVLTAEERTQIGDAQLRVEALVTLSVALAALAGTVVLSWLLGERPVPDAGFSVGVFVLHGMRWAIAVVAASVVLSILTYHSAVFAYRGLAEGIIRLVDLNRLKLLTALGYPLPKTVSAELGLWKELRGFFAQARPLPPDRALQGSPAPKKSE